MLQTALYSLALAGAADVPKTHIWSLKQAVSHSASPSPRDDSLFDDIDKALASSTIDADERARVWNRRSFDGLAARWGEVEAARQLISRFSTSHTALYTPDDVEYYELAAITLYGFGEVEESIRSIYGEDGPNYVGVGAWFRRPENPTGYWTVSQVFPGSVAAQSGLMPGDEVLSANGQRFGPVKSFKAYAGKPVSLSVRRKGRAVTLEVVPINIDPLRFYTENTRSSAKVLTISGKAIGYLKGLALYRRTDFEFLRETLTTGTLANVDAFVLDIRGGWGGTPLDFAAPFVGGLPSQSITLSSGSVRNLNWNYCKPVVVLVDATTRSGKEIFAAAMKLGSYPIVGQKTAGEVLSTRAELIRDGAFLLELPRAKVFIQGEALEGVGVSPTHLSVAQGVDDSILDDGLALAASLPPVAKARSVCSGKAPHPRGNR